MKSHLSIKDKWSLDEQFGAALRALDKNNEVREETLFREQLEALMHEYEIPDGTVLQWCRSGILRSGYAEG